PRHPEPLDEQSAERRRDDDRHASQDRLDREADDPAGTFELLADERERGGQSERLPGHHEKKPEEDTGHGSPQEIDEESEHGQRSEEKKRPAVAETIGEPAARIGVRRVQKILQRPERPDDERRRAEKPKVLRNVTGPELLAQTEDEDARRHRGEP